MNKSTFAWSNYWKPTPKNFRKWGDAILASATLVASMNLDNAQVAVWCAIGGALGKFTTNFFAD